MYDPGNQPESSNPSILVPVWQIAPIETNQKAVMFNLHSEKNRQRSLDHMVDMKVPCLTALLQLVQDSDLRPSSILFYPVFDAFQKTGEKDGQSAALQDPGGSNVVGSVSIVFSWDTLLQRILPDYIKGIYCILRCSTGQAFTYKVSGDDVTLLGEGDQRSEGDFRFDKYQTVEKAELAVGYDYVTYELHMYPSSEFEGQYVTKKAAVYASGVVLIFLFTASLFLLYDYLVENRQQRTEQEARLTSNIVESLFPATFRERLYSIQNSSVGESTRRRDSHIGSGSSGDSSQSKRHQDDEAIDELEHSKFTRARAASTLNIAAKARRSKMGIKQIERYMKKLGNTPCSTDADLLNDSTIIDDEPIAELFHDTSIMFCDIVGEFLLLLVNFACPSQSIDQRLPIALRIHKMELRAVAQRGISTAREPVLGVR